MAESCAVTLTKVDTSGTDPSGIRKLTFTWVTASNGSLTSTAITANMAKVLTGLKAVLAVTNPSGGATAPTDNYDITITDADGVDIFGGALNNRDEANSEQARPAIATLAGERLVDGVLTFNLSGNSVDSAAGVCKVYFTK